MYAHCDYREWNVMPYSQQPKPIRCQTAYVLLKWSFIYPLSALIWKLRNLEKVIKTLNACKKVITLQFVAMKSSACQHTSKRCT